MLCESYVFVMIGVDSEKWIEWLLIMICTWKTVRQDCGNVSKWLRVSSLTSENFPPKICIPNNENIKMKRNKITSSEFIDEIEFTSDLTKLPNDDQYLKYTAFSAITHKKSPNNSDRLILYALCLLLLYYNVLHNIWWFYVE